MLRCLAGNNHNKSKKDMGNTALRISAYQSIFISKDANKFTTSGYENFACFNLLEGISITYPLASLKSALRISHLKNCVASNRQFLKLLSCRSHSSNMLSCMILPEKSNFLNGISIKELYFM